LKLKYQIFLDKISTFDDIQRTKDESPTTTPTTPVSKRHPRLYPTRIHASPCGFHINTPNLATNLKLKYQIFLNKISTFEAILTQNGNPLPQDQQPPSPNDIPAYTQHTFKLHPVGSTQTHSRSKWTLKNEPNSPQKPNKIQH